MIFLCVGFSPAVRAQDQDSIIDAVKAGKLLLNLRPRYEHVEQDGKTFDANAPTLRSLVGWQTASYRGFSAMAQLIDVGRLNSNYNDSRNGQTQFPTVADPDDTDLNQLYIDYDGWQQTRFRLGKQSIKLDNVRFVGNVEFRQVMQVFTGVTAENKSISHTTLYAGHLEHLKTVFTDERHLTFEILHGAYEWSPGNQLTGYGYFLNEAKTVSATGFADNSNRILGLRADGAYSFGTPPKLLYTAEFASQRNYSGGDARIDANYYRLGAGAGWDTLYVRLDREVLGSNNGLYGFQTPLGTNHLFQGWADLFLTTPTQGIRDTFVSLGGSIEKAKWSAEIHDFKSDSGSIHFGHEIDFGVSYPLRRDLQGKVEYATFRESDVLTPVGARKRDTDKLWLTLVYSY